MHRFFEILGNSKKRKRLVLCGLFLANILVWAAFLSFPARKLRIYFLDVGQGDSAFVRVPERNTILIDGGASDNVLSQLGKVMPFWEKSLDLLVISHWDADHITGLAGVLENYEVKNIAYPAFDCESMICKKVKNLIEQEGVRKLKITAAGKMSFGSAEINALWPSLDCSLGSNNCSVVLLLDVGNFEALFTGDIEESGQRRVLGRGALSKIELLKVPHHGADCLADSFLSVLSPLVSVVSVGKNSYGHPTNATLRKLEDIGSRVLRTDQEGTIEVIADDNGWQVK